MYNFKLMSTQYCFVLLLCQNPPPWSWCTAGFVWWQQETLLGTWTLKHFPKTPLGFPWAKQLVLGYMRISSRKWMKLWTAAGLNRTLQTWTVRTYLLFSKQYYTFGWWKQKKNWPALWHFAAAAIWNSTDAGARQKDEEEQRFQTPALYHTATEPDTRAVDRRSGAERIRVWDWKKSICWTQLTTTHSYFLSGRHPCI